MKIKKILLDGTWKMKKIGGNAEYTAQVPGTVLSVLKDNGEIEDPFYRMNEYKIRELFWEDYEFTREFVVEKSLLKKEKQVLVCEGLDTLAEIFINGKRAGDADNMHRTWRIPLNGFLQEGLNDIKILFHSPLRYIEEYKYGENRTVQYVPCGCMKGNHLLRKAHSMFGWDWGPQLVDMGIIRNVSIEAWDGSRVEDVLIRQEHENGNVRLEIRIQHSGEPIGNKTVVRLWDEDGTLTAEKEKLTGQITELELMVTKAKLWWSAGYGSQYLYRLEIVQYDRQGIQIEKIEKTIGLRTLTVSRDRDAWGREFAFQVNGVKIFAMGGNYIPEDCIYPEISKERQEYLVRSMSRANYNCVRIWGGGYYPTDYFYDLCDRYGLIVWQDLMFACNVYEVTDHFAENCRREVLDNLKRLRHHACLGIICGNNEIESAWHHWEDFQKESAYLRADYIRLFEEILPKAVKEAAPDIFYWKSSPSSGGCFDDPDNENDGDTHYWSVWHGQLPFTDYANHYFRFCSEFGFQSFPSMKTVESFTMKEDRNIFSRVMESHQKNDAANGKMLYYLSENFRCPSSMDHILYISQILQGIAVKYGVEHWRRNRGRCMGALYWQVNDNWPAPSWSSIDYFGRWKALHYMAKEFFSREAASLTVKDNIIQLHVENEGNNVQKYQAFIRVKKMDLTVVEEVTANGSVDEFCSAMALSLDLSACKQYQSLKEAVGDAGDPDEELFIEGTVLFESGMSSRVVETLLPYKYLRLPDPKYHIETSRSPGRYEICMEADAAAFFVELEISGADVIFSENYFHVTEGMKKAIYINEEDILRGKLKNEQDLLNRLRIRSVVDTYREP